MGLFKSIGSMFNDITGATSAAKQQNAYQKEAAQNAHQWEMADLKKAGLNPALTATGGSGASANGFGGSTGASGMNPISVIGELVDMNNRTSATESQNNLNNAQAMKIIEMLPFEKDEKLKIIQKLSTGASLDEAMTEYTKRRGSGKGVSIHTPLAGGAINW